METQSTDLSLKFRITGALVWLLLLIIIVPSWYSHPVHFSPNVGGEISEQDKNSVVVDKPFVLPVPTEKKGVPSQSVEPAYKKALNLPQADTNANSHKAPSAVNQKKKNVTEEATASLEQVQQKLDTKAFEGKWIIRIAAYRSKEKAHLLHEQLKYDYDVFVKYFPKSKYYSVRVGPYSDKQRAIKDQQKLNMLLRVHTELAKINLYVNSTQ